PDARRISSCERSSNSYGLLFRPESRHSLLTGEHFPPGSSEATLQPSVIDHRQRSTWPSLAHAHHQHHQQKHQQRASDSPCESADPHSREGILGGMVPTLNHHAEHGTADHALHHSDRLVPGWQEPSQKTSGQSTQQRPLESYEHHAQQCAKDRSHDSPTDASPPAATFHPVLDSDHLSIPRSQPPADEGQQDRSNFCPHNGVFQRSQGCSEDGTVVSAQAD